MIKVIFEKLFKWVFFTVLISLLPIAFGLSTLYLNDEPINIFQCTNNGEFFLISVCISAGVLGELFGSSKKLINLKIATGGLICTIMILSSYNFAEVWKANISNQAYLPENIFLASVITIICTLFCCFTGIIISEL